MLSIAPGTGKTTTICELIAQYIKVYDYKILVCSASNLAVDNIVERLTSEPYNNKTTNINCIRFGNPARLLSNILSHSLDSIVMKNDYSKSCNDIRNEIQQLINKLKKLNDKSERISIRNEIKNLKKDLSIREKKAVSDTVKNCNVVCSTLTNVVSKQLDNLTFDVCIIDEAAQAIEIACLLPIVKCKKLILAGDHCQLGPTIKSDYAASHGLQITLFERLMQQYNNQQCSILLNKQYRMNEIIMNWSSNEFYNNKLIADNSVAKHLLIDLPHIKHNNITSTAFMLIDTAGCNMYEVVSNTDCKDIEELISDSKSNIHEADIVVKHVELLLHSGVKPYDICVIAPYTAQVSVLRDLLVDKYNNQLEIGTVDGLQGREKQCIIISMTRSNVQHDIGFLSETRRMNVAITRAQRHVCLIADSETVSSNTFLARLIDYVSEHGEVYSAAEYDQSIVDDEIIDDRNLSTNDTTQNNNSAIDAILNGNNNKPHVIKHKKRNGKTPKQQQQKQLLDNSIANNDNNKIDDITHKIADDNVLQPLDKPKLTEAGIRQICNDMKQRIKQGDVNATYKFSPSLDSIQRKLIHSIAEQIGSLSHESVGRSNNRHIVLRALNNNNNNNTDSDDQHNQPNSIEQCNNNKQSTTTIQQQTKQQQQQHQDLRSTARLKAIEAMEQRSKAKFNTNVMPKLNDNNKTSIAYNVLHDDDSNIHDEHKDDTIDNKNHTDKATVRHKIHNNTNIQTNNNINKTSNDDIDSILAELKVDHCYMNNCNTKSKINLQQCQFCNKYYCWSHINPVVHSDDCMRRYGQHKRNQDIKQYKQQSSGVNHSKPLKPSERSILQQKLDKAKQRVERGNKKK